MTASLLKFYSPKSFQVLISFVLFESFYKRKMADNSHKMSYHAGEAKGQAQEKVSTMMEKASDAAQSAKESVQEAGQQMKAKAQGAAEAVKDSLNK